MAQEHQGAGEALSGDRHRWWVHTPAPMGCLGGALTVHTSSSNLSSAAHGNSKLTVYLLLASFTFLPQFHAAPYGFCEIISQIHPLHLNPWLWAS